MKKCGLYVRVSTDRQAQIKDGSLDTQESRLRSYVEIRNNPEEKWEVVQVYREAGKSGKNIERNELQRMILDIKRNSINVVLCTKIDRITRSLLDFYKLYELFEKYNVEFITLDESVDTSSPSGKAILKIILIFAELEREQTSKRTREKMQWRAEQGLWNGGQILGYDIIDGRLVPNEEEAKLIKLVFEKYIELGSVKGVAEYLNEYGYKTKQYISNKGNVRGGKSFFNTNVLQKLTNVVYTGKITHKNEIYPGQHESIIDEKLWKKANNLLKQNSPKRKNFRRKTKHVFILQGLVKCGWCGSYMSPKYSTGRNGLHFYYQCTKNAHGGNKACNMRYVPALELERVVLERIKEISLQRDLIEKIVKKANKSNSGKLEQLKLEKIKQENSLVPIRTKIDNIVDYISMGYAKNSSTSEKLLELEKQKEQIEKQIFEIDFKIKEVNNETLDARIMADSLTKFSQICEVATNLEKKNLIPLFVDKIVWTPTQIEIALYDQPTMKGLLETESVNQISDGALKVSDWLLG